MISSEKLKQIYGFYGFPDDSHVFFGMIGVPKDTFSIGNRIKHNTLLSGLLWARELRDTDENESFAGMTVESLKLQGFIQSGQTAHPFSSSGHAHNSGNMHKKSFPES